MNVVGQSVAVPHGRGSAVRFRGTAVYYSESVPRSAGIIPAMFTARYVSYIGRAAVINIAIAVVNYREGRKKFSAGALGVGVHSKEKKT